MCAYLFLIIQATCTLSHAPQRIMLVVKTHCNSVLALTSWQSTNIPKLVNMANMYMYVHTSDLCWNNVKEKHTPETPLYTCTIQNVSPHIQTVSESIPGVQSATGAEGYFACKIPGDIQPTTIPVQHVQANDQVSLADHLVTTTIGVNVAQKLKFWSDFALQTDNFQKKPSFPLFIFFGGGGGVETAFLLTIYF